MLNPVFCRSEVFKICLIPFLYILIIGKHKQNDENDEENKADDRDDLQQLYQTVFTFIFVQRSAPFT